MKNSIVILLSVLVLVSCKAEVVDTPTLTEVNNQPAVTNEKDITLAVNTNQESRTSVVTEENIRIEKPLLTTDVSKGDKNGVSVDPVLDNATKDEEFTLDAKTQQSEIITTIDEPTPGRAEDTIESVATKVDSDANLDTAIVKNEIQESEENSLSQEEGGEANIHDTWHTLLSTYVSSTGKVDYAGIKKRSTELDAYLKALKDARPEESDTSPKALAYWINAYNAFTVKLIVDNYPVGSITDLHGGKPWDQKWIKLGSKTYSLNDIEHGLIRPVFNDARIHFAVNCAAKSCPKLANQAYTEKNVDQLLEISTKDFVNNADYNVVTASSAQLSKIFEWYKEDFDDLKSYINQFANTKLQDGGDISFKEYNWALNSK